MGHKSLTLLIEALTTFRSYNHVVSWDLSKAYNTFHTGQAEKHMRRLVWRWGSKERDWQVFGFTRIAFGDQPAACGLEVAKSLAISAGAAINPEVAEELQIGSYIDNACGGGEKENVNKLRGQLTFDKGKPHYDGLVTQIFGLGGFKVKVMVHDGNKDTAITQLLGGGVLGVLWEPEYD